MDYRDSSEQAAFRVSLRVWLRDNAPEQPLPRDEVTRDDVLHDWHRRLYEGGWMGLSWPVALGGRALEPYYEAILSEELGVAGAPSYPGSVGYLGRALLLGGSDEQRQRYIPDLLSGAATWCQGYSEPDAGSDLAALSTRATRSDSGYVINGSKVWTSYAHHADYCMVLARSEPDAPRHRGISTFIVDMKSPGVTLRRIVQITGDREFSEVFFDDVFVPREQMVGEPGSGWSLAMSTLAYERGPVDIGLVVRFRAALDQLERAVRDGEVAADATMRSELARCYVDIEVLRLQVLRSLSARTKSASPPGPEGSIDKLLMTAADQRLYKTAMVLFGSAACLGAAPQWLHDYLYSRAASIYGGTSQIQKNILATRVLALPVAR